MKNESKATVTNVSQEKVLKKYRSISGKVTAIVREHRHIDVAGKEDSGLLISLYRCLEKDKPKGMTALEALEAARLLLKAHDFVVEAQN